MRALLGMVVVLVLSWGAPAGAVIIASGDGTGNTSAPPDDPGWAHFGARSYASSVYIGDGWMLTADHVPTGDVEIEGVLYRWVPGSEETLDPADLKLFRIESDPGLPPLAIATGPPAGEVLLIGAGRNRGVPIYDWDGNPDLDGWYWGTGRAIRWGTNDVKNVSVQSPPGSGIFFFTVDFSAFGGTEDECQVAAGDSGGPVFSKNGGTWELTGIQVTRTLYGGQLEESALFGNESWSAQLSPYRNQILGILAQPAACENGIDDDGDGLVDYPDDPGCLGLDDAFERRAGLPCDDGFDNDGDGGIDFDQETYDNPGDQHTPPAGEGDPGCGSPTWTTESPQCQDGLHNDFDGQMDYDAGVSANGTADPNGPDWQCLGKPWKHQEQQAASTCGLGSELAFLLPLLIWIHRRRH